MIAVTLLLIVTIGLAFILTSKKPKENKEVKWLKQRIDKSGRYIL